MFSTGDGCLTWPGVFAWLEPTCPLPNQPSEGPKWQVSTYTRLAVALKVALKMLKPDLDKRVKEREAFMRELADTLETAR